MADRMRIKRMVGAARWGRLCLKAWVKCILLITFFDLDVHSTGRMNEH